MNREIRLQELHARAVRDHQAALDDVERQRKWNDRVGGFTGIIRISPEAIGIAVGIAFLLL